MQVTAADKSASRSGVFWWVLGGLGLFVVGWVVSLMAIAMVEQLVFDPLGIRAEAGEVSLSIRNGLHQLVWGVAVAAVSIPVGRGLVPEVRFSLRGAGVLVVGLTLAALCEFLIVEFDRVRSGEFGVRHVGMAIAAPPAIVGVALAAWAALALPLRNRAALVTLAAAAGAGFVLAMLPSLGGLSDGINPESIPLAACLVASAGFAVLAPLIARR
jgi:hypothetical protein